MAQAETETEAAFGGHQPWIASIRQATNSAPCRMFCWSLQSDELSSSTMRFTLPLFSVLLFDFGCLTNNTVATTNVDLRHTPARFFMHACRGNLCRKPNDLAEMLPGTTLCNCPSEYICPSSYQLISVSRTLVAIYLRSTIHPHTAGC